jgi:hypothetical protein
MAAESSLSTTLNVSSRGIREVGKTSGLEYIDLHPSSESSHQFTLQSLAKFTSYQVVVQAFNTQGDGPTSTSMVATTLEDGEHLAAAARGTLVIVSVFQFRAVPRLTSAAKVGTSTPS